MMLVGMFAAVMALPTFYTSDVVGNPGGNSVVSIVRNDPSPIVGFQIDLAPGPGVHIVDCRAAAGGKGVFFSTKTLPDCERGFCEVTRVISLSLDDSVQVPFTPGVMAECIIAVDASQPPGWYPISCRNATVTPPCPDGNCVTESEQCVPGYVAILMKEYTCPTADQDSNGAVSINEVISVVNSALNGCE